MSPDRETPAADAQPLVDRMLCIGAGLLEHGAEVYRVEEALRRLGRAYGASEFSAFVIPSAIILTLSLPGAPSVSKMRQTRVGDTNLDLVDQYNQLVRDLCAAPGDTRQIDRRLAAIAARSGYPRWLQILVYGTGAASFALFFGGSWQDAVVAGLIGALLRGMGMALRGIRQNAFFVNLLCAAAGSAIAQLTAAWLPGAAADKITIGMLMTLVPGIVFTNALRDFMAGDALAGTIKVTEALLIGAGIAVGVSVMLAVLQPVLGVV